MGLEKRLDILVINSWYLLALLIMTVVKRQLIFFIPN